MSKTKTYDWQYVSIGGVVRVKLTNGEDIAHLGELDQKKWTVLSCPVDGLEFDRKTLELLDADGDGKIRVKEVVEAAEWLTSVIRDKDLILKGEDSLPLAQLNEDVPAGKKLKDSAKQILSNLGLDKDSISTADTSDSVAIFAKTKFNGDGVITAASADDEELAKVITSCIDTLGGVQDRSGELGVDADKIGAFYAALADYSGWKAAADADKASIFPYGDNTEAALAACEAVKDKVADFFMRCKLINFDESVSAAVDVSADKVAAISGQDLGTCVEEIASYPLARPSKEKVLPLDAINPAWQAAMDSVRALVLDVDFHGKKSITEDEWKSVLAKFGAYTAWKGAKKGEAVEPLGLDWINATLKADRSQALLDLIARDKALEAESASIDEVDKLMHFYKYFFRFLNNYVVFSDFYGRNETKKAVFEAGKLYIDERCCNLCLKVNGPGNHAEAASLSGMFLIYCTCTSKKFGKTQEIVAVMTSGGIKNLRPGKNAIFYDFEGNDWDAVVTKIVDNPISIRQAFWSPYRKLAKFVSDKIDKSAAEKDSAATADLLAKVDNADPKAPKQPFDIGKFAGIFAAVGMAFAGIGVALKALVSGIVALSWWQFLLVIVAIMLVISGPACFIAWRKLRKRNLGPVLNANGWAINSEVLVNILFGGTLTSTAKYPLVKTPDPFSIKVPVWKKIICWFVAAVVAAFIVLLIAGKNGCTWSPFYKEAAIEEVVEVEPAVEEGTVQAVE